jgi:hypothetical protein
MRGSGRLDFEGATLDNPGGDAADLAGSACAVLFLLPRSKPEGVIDLTNAQAGSYCDDQETWAGTVRLRGFAYGKLENDTISLVKRLAWLKRNGDGYAPGPTTSWPVPTAALAAPMPPAGSRSPGSASAGPDCPGQGEHGTGSFT